MAPRLPLLMIVLTASIAAAMFSVANSGSTAVAQQLDYAELRARAERYYAEGSYRRAQELYWQARDLELDDGERRWVEFRLGDSAWRAAAGSGNSSQAVIEAARRQLLDVIDGIGREPGNDSLWVDAQESLGDSWWLHGNRMSWESAWEHYAPAFDWWARSTDLEVARARYLAMVWRIAPRLIDQYWSRAEGDRPPFEILDHAVAIATNDAERARAHLLLARLLHEHGETLELQQRVTPEFEAALAASEGTEWRDDVLAYFGFWMNSEGPRVPLEDGFWNHHADPPRALALLRSLVAEYGKDETPHYDGAVRQIDVITNPHLRISTSNAFLPGSEIEVQLDWRNVASVDLQLYEIELHRSPAFSPAAESSTWQWLETIDLSQTELRRSWSISTPPVGEHAPGQHPIRIDGELPVGAYVLEATAADSSAENPVRSRELVLVTDAALVLKRSDKEALVYFCDALSGAPIAGASVSVWEGGNKYIDGHWTPTWTQRTATTGADGIAVVPLDGLIGFFVAAARDGRQAFSTDRWARVRTNRDPWKVYAFTDRSVYRPGDQAHWKLTARRDDGSVYSTPANETLWYEINDPHGATVVAAEVELNAFGSAWGQLQLSDVMPLGEYTVSFKNKKNGRRFGSATLLRLEEYKLPEFEVRVESPTDADGRRKSFRPGDTVEVNIRAEYYSGGAVSDATVEVVVYRNAFRHSWRPQREFAWYYDEDATRFRDFGFGQVLLRQTLSADADGTATLTFTAPPSTEEDFQYRIEARVSNASRREIVGVETLRVTRQRAFVYARPRHYLVRPDDTAQVDFNVLDANQQPLQASGQVTVTRDTWQQERRGYEHEEIVSAPIRTDVAGEAHFEFVPEREGYYAVTFEGVDDEGSPIAASTTVWAASNQSTELGFRHGGLGIIADEDTFRVGETAPVMLTTSDSDRYVLFSVSGDDLYSYQLVHVTGTAKLLQVELHDQHVPNIYLGATMVAERDIHNVVRQVIVPPTRNFLEVELEASADQYQPGDEGEITVHVSDRDGRPVAAEVALALVDEATFYIQQEYAPDPRQHFFGTERRDVVGTTSTLQQRRYVDLVEADDGELIERPGHDVEHRGWRSRIQASKPRAPWTYDGVEFSDMSANGAAGMYYDFDAFERVRALGYVGGTGSAVEPTVQVRSDFRATAFWQPDVVTGADGTATVSVTYPDSLTSWRATARVASATNQFGVAITAARTDKPLIVRLQVPRFFVAGDTATVSAVINNNTDEAVTAMTSLAAEGLRVVGAGRDNTSEAAPTRIAPGGEGRVDWTVQITDPGPVRLAVLASSPDNNDAMERRLIAHDHGLEKLVAAAGKLQGDEVGVRLNLPAARQAGSTGLEVQLTPSVAVTMLDALPYLIDFPYGCTEQTLSRFLPAVITTRTLGDLGLAPAAVLGRVFGGIEPDYAAGPGAAQRGELQQLDDVVQRGLTRLYDFQHDDGGWGWWEGGDSDHFMTAYAVWGLALARDAGIVVRKEALEPAVRFLGLELAERDDEPDLQAWMLHALAVYAAVQTRQQPPAVPARPPRPDRVQQAAEERARFEAARQAAFDNVWQRRDQLNAYSRALLALSAHHLGLREQAMVLVRNLANGVRRDQSPDVSILQPAISGASAAPLPTAHWGQRGGWWRWSDGGVEATSFALRALLAIDPGNLLIEPATNWLIKNRRGAQWSNTRDTSIAVLALNDYLEASGELQTDIEYELQVNGTFVARRRVAGEDILRAPSQVVIDPGLIVDGANDIRIVRLGGDGPLYFAAEATFLSREEPIAAAGNEIFVQREYNRLIGRKTLLKGYAYDRQPLHEGDSVTSGERLEVVIRIEAKNDYEYLMFEDLKPAGLETVAVRSGASLTARELESGARWAALGADVGDTKLGPDDYTGRSRWVYQELRDRKVALFVDKLPQGLWEIRYQVRAEVPGEFHALPIVGQAMYVPEIRANGQEQRLRVLDGPRPN